MSITGTKGGCRWPRGSLTVGTHPPHDGGLPESTAGREGLLNSLAPGRSECESKNGIFNLVLLIGIFRSSRDNALRWMPQDRTDDKSTLVQVMAWCRQAPSHYLSQCWLSPLSPYGVARPQWVNSLVPGWCGSYFQNILFQLGLGFCLLSPSGHFFTRHGRPWSNPTLDIGQYCGCWCVAVKVLALQHPKG